MKPDRLRGRYSVRPGYWFAPKAFGWGAVPVTWQGWVTTLAFVCIAAAIANIAEHRGPVWLVFLAPLIAVFIWLTWSKTDGGWAFRWGRDD